MQVILVLCIQSSLVLADEPKLVIYYVFKYVHLRVWSSLFPHIINRRGTAQVHPTLSTMCITLWSTQNQLGYRLILASNRDEYLLRSSSPAHFHSFENITQGIKKTPPPLPPPRPSTLLTNDKKNQFHDFEYSDNHINRNPILSGRDLIAGGTWLGINHSTGKFSFLTNVNSRLDTMVSTNIDGQDDGRAERSCQPRSRGTIIADFLLGNQDVKSYIGELKSSQASQRMNGYNLVIGEIAKTETEDDEIAFFCNRDPEGRTDSRMGGLVDDRSPEDRGASDSTMVYGLSNGIAQQPPIWPKVTRGIHLMKDCLDHKIFRDKDHAQADQDELEMNLFNLLSDTNAFSQELRDNILIHPHHRLETPGIERSSETWYGTRTQTLLLASRTTPTKITLLERDGFHIDLKASPEHPLGKPVWLGNDRSRWRRFEFDLPIQPKSTSTSL